MITTTFWGTERHRNVVVMLVDSPILVGHLQRTLLALRLLRALQRDLGADSRHGRVGFTGDTSPSTWDDDPEEGLEIGDDHHRFCWKRARAGRREAGDSQALVQHLAQGKPEGGAPQA